jgi:kinetochore protein Spc24
MRPIIDPEEDYLTIVAVEQTVTASEAKRKKEVEEAHANLKGLLPDIMPQRQTR